MAEVVIDLHPYVFMTFSTQSPSRNLEISQQEIVAQACQNWHFVSSEGKSYWIESPKDSTLDPIVTYTP